MTNTSKLKPLPPLFLRLFLLSTLFCQCLSSAYAAENPIIRDNSFQISLSPQSALSLNHYELQISVAAWGGAFEKPFAFTIENPSRLVVDIPGISTTTPRQVTLPYPKIESVRTGVHPKKLRVVVDLKGKTLPSFSLHTSPSRDKVSLFFQFPEKRASQFQAPPKPPRIEEKRIVTQLSKKPAKPVQETPRAKKLAPQKLPAPPALIERIDFSLFPDSSKQAIVIGVKNLGTYTLSRKKDTMFELTLERSKLAGEHLTYAQFPPDNFQGFDGVVASERDKDVVIKLYVEPGAALSPFRKEQELWIHVTD